MADAPPLWKVVLSVINPKDTRPRRMSLHTLAHCLGLETEQEVLALAADMKESGEVVGYVCPDVNTPVFYLKELAKLPGMIDTRDAKVWTQIEKWLKDYPYPAVKGFKRFPEDLYGKKPGKVWNFKTHTHEDGLVTDYSKPDYSKYGLPYAFEAEDKDYAAAITEALAKVGVKRTLAVTTK